MTEQRRDVQQGAEPPEMPWVAAWRYAKGRAFSGWTPLFWVTTVAGLAAFDVWVLGWPVLRAVLSSMVFVVVMELVEFARRFLSGPPVGEAGRDDL